MNFTHTFKFAQDLFYTRRRINLLDSTLIKENENLVLDFLFYWHRPIRVGDLKNHLQIKHSTLNSVLNRLEKDHLVEWEKYGPVQLTEKGVQHASHLSNHHFIIEKFFKEILDLSEKKAHDEALHLAGALSCAIIEAMGKKLGISTESLHDGFCDQRSYKKSSSPIKVKHLKEGSAN